MVRGIVFTIVGASLWGFSGSCTQFLFAHYDIDPLFITAVRMVGSGLIFLALLIATQRDGLHAVFCNGQTLRKMLVFGVVGLFTCQVTYIISIDYTNAGTATVLQMLNIVFVIVGTCIATRHRPRLMDLVGFVLAMVATVLIATKGNLDTLAIPLPGLVWGVINAASVAFYITYPRDLYAQLPSMVVVGLGMLSGGIATLLLWGASMLVSAASKGAVPPLATLPSLTLPGYAVLGLIVVAGTFAAFGLYLHGVSIVGGVRGSLLGAVEPVSATVVSALWLGTVFTWPDWLGMALIIATVFIVTLQRPR
jgi:drug/metabolite transporter (DMT)-like permease